MAAGKKTSAKQPPKKSRKKPRRPPATIALNKKARHDYFIEEKMEAGLALLGWEVKSLRAGKGQISDSYILLKDAEAFLFGALIAPLPAASTHVAAEPRRTRKLLLHRRQLRELQGAKERKGYAIVPTAMYWKRGLIKLEIGLARGKKQHDKRETEKRRAWEREKQRALKRGK